MGKDTGFGPDHLLTMRLTPPGSAYQDSQQVVGLYERLLDRVSALPGVESAAVVNPFFEVGQRNCHLLNLMMRKRKDSQPMYAQSQTTHLKYSRRGFFVLAGTGLYTVGHPATSIEGITARQVIERIQEHVGVEWRSETVDTFKIGNPDTIVKGIATSFSATLDVCRRAHAAGKNLLIVHEPGFNNFPGIMRTLNSSDVDVLVIGETREWEGIEYARDVNTARKKKGLIVLGHVPSEERGMEECAKWLKTFITEVPIQYLPGGDPLWRPKS